MTFRNFKLPHLHPIGATYSLLLCVADAVPKDLLTRLNEERRSELQRVQQSANQNKVVDATHIQYEYDRKFNELLKKHANQEHPLANPDAAQIMVEILQKYAGKYYVLYSYCVMSNHVHAELDLSIQLPEGFQTGDELSRYIPLSKVVQLIKGGSAYSINKLLGRSGKPLWPKRYRDRFIRGERHLMAAYHYTLNNSVVAGLSNHHSEHPFTGGMSLEEIGRRRPRRVYPFAGEYYDQLAEYDKQNPKRNKPYSRSHGL